MAVRTIIQIGHPALKAKNEVIFDFSDLKLSQLIIDLRDTMVKNQLIGIAAPQIAENYKMFVTEPRQTTSRKLTKTDKFRVYINPQITFFSKEENVIYEGCGSVLNGLLFGPVKRPKEIIIEAFDEKEGKFQIHTDGILGRVIQHEYDHLHGVEFTEKVLDYRKLMHRDFYIERIKNSREQVAASKISILEYKPL
ncbi:peptide deformylase [Candidatus Gottesmanbacteria bacterium]|nr:peptide deformylase [Candidatus Gottesmanbacteria bacterium]